MDALPSTSRSSLSRSPFDGRDLNLPPMEFEDPVSSTGAGDSVHHGGAAEGTAYPAHSLTYAEASAVVTASPGDLRTFDFYERNGMNGMNGMYEMSGMNASGQPCGVLLTRSQYLVLRAIMRNDSWVYKDDFREETGAPMDNKKVARAVNRLQDSIKNVTAAQIIYLQKKGYYLSCENNPGTLKFKGYSLTQQSMIKHGKGKHLALTEKGAKIIKALRENEGGCTIKELAQKCSCTKQKVGQERKKINEGFKTLGFGNIKIASHRCHHDDVEEKVRYHLEIGED